MSTKHLTIAVAGADGRVGSAVVLEALAQGHIVVGLDATRESLVERTERYTYKQVDTMNFEAYKAAVEGCDALVHLAATMNKVKDDEGNRTRPTAPHEIHNNSVAMSFNALNVAEELGINRVVLASSVNSVGMLYSATPRFDYLPIDENHPCRPEDAYSLCKLIVEVQADAFARRFPAMRIATMRFHWVVPEDQVDPKKLNQKGEWKDLWGFTPVKSAARACVNALTVSEEQFPTGHEPFFIVAQTSIKQEDSYELLRTKFPDLTDLRADFERSNKGFYDTSKAERMLGWKDKGFPWHA